jgi:hypothetical protein
MAWYADLEHLDYFDGFIEVDTTILRAVGWLLTGTNSNKVASLSPP